MCCRDVSYLELLENFQVPECRFTAHELRTVQRDNAGWLDAVECTEAIHDIGDWKREKHLWNTSVRVSISNKAMEPP